MSSIGVSPAKYQPSYSEWKHTGQHKPEKHASVMPIAPPKLWFLSDAPQPLEAQFLDGIRCPPNCACLKMDCHPQVSAKWNYQPTMISMQPKLPLLSAQGYYEQIRPARINFIDKSIVA